MSWQDFEDLSRKHAQALSIYNEGKDEVGFPHTKSLSTDIESMTGETSATPKCGHRRVYYHRSAELRFLVHVIHLQNRCGKINIFIESM
jgi:hypothetical protein